MLCDKKKGSLEYSFCSVEMAERKHPHILMEKLYLKCFERVEITIERTKGRNL